MSVLKERKCGCVPCVDTETFTHTNTAPCCDQCPEFQSPCLWIAKFGCVIRPDTGCANPNTHGIACAEVYLRPECYFSDTSFTKQCDATSVVADIPGGNCRWVALGRRLSQHPGCNECLPCAGADERGVLAPTAAPCSWRDITMPSPIVLPPTTVYGISWVLTIRATNSTLEWDHPTLGLLRYTKPTAWSCAGSNTMVLTSGGAAVPELPPFVCVVPHDAASGGGCNPEVPCGYSATNRCLCCDPCCVCLKASLYFDCTTAPSSVTPNIAQLCDPPARAPQGMAVGRARGTSWQVVHLGVTRTVEATAYCLGSAGWQVDIWIDGTFVGTSTLAKCCCSLVMGGAGPDVTAYFPGCTLYFAAWEGEDLPVLLGDCDAVNPVCYLGTDSFDVAFGDCTLGIGPITLNFSRVNRRCWVATANVSCGTLVVRICCVGGGFVASWFLSCATPQTGTCTVMGNPITGITLDCFDCAVIADGTCSACPPCGNCLPAQPLILTCGDCTASTTVTPCLSGGDFPSPTEYGACATLCGKRLCANWFHVNCQWYAKVWIEGVFCETVAIDHTCCPLSLSTGQVSCVASGCCVVIGPCSSGGGCGWIWNGTTWDLDQNPGCTPGCICGNAPTRPGTFIGEAVGVNCVGACVSPDPCCPGLSLPTMLTLSDGTNSLTLTGAGGLARSWGATGTICGSTGPWGVSCTAGNGWVLSGPAGSFALTGTCDPVNLSATGPCPVTVVE